MTAFELWSLSASGKIIDRAPFDNEAEAWSAYNCALEALCKSAGSFELRRTGDGKKLASGEKKTR